MSADPRTQFDLVHNFWQQLLVLDQRVLERARRTAARRRMRRMLVIAVLLILALAAIGLATGLLERGEDAKPAFPAARAMALARLPGTLKIVPTTAADPDGGPPWSLRAFDTENETCFQVGRLVEGKLAVIGIKGAFGNDNRYHVLPVEPIACGGFRGLPTVFGGGGTFHTSGIQDDDCGPGGTKTCDPDELRGVLVGGTGHHAVSVTLRAAGQVVTQPIVEHRYGTYLFVLRGPVPQYGSMSVTYDDGMVCPLGSGLIGEEPRSRTCRRHANKP